MRRRLLSCLLLLPLAFLFISPCLADSGSRIDTGDTTWIMISAALVFFMMPGLAFFYGGLVRKMIGNCFLP